VSPSETPSAGKTLATKDVPLRCIPLTAKAADLRGALTASTVPAGKSERESARMSRDQIVRAERLIHVLRRLDDCSVDVVALLDALGMSGLMLAEDDDGEARDAYEQAVEDVRTGDLE
jgi:hypothetical protein